MPEQEQIDRAAIRHVDGTVYSVPRPGRHHHIIAQMGARYIERRAEGHTQGFLTNTGRFVDSKEAFLIATAMGQIIQKPLGDPEKLYSDDMW